MRFAAWLGGLMLLLAAAAVGAEGKGTVVALDSLKSTTPADWKEEAPQGTLRMAQFLLPRAKEDKNDGEVVIFKAGGGPRANIERWKMQFTAPTGKKLDDVAKVTEIKVAGRPAVQLDVEGTYNTTPFDPKHKGAKLPGYRMVAIYLEAPDNSYQVKFYGPAMTVEQHKKAFEDWIKAFK